MPKGNGEFWGVGLVEVIWKALLGVVNRRIKMAVKFHDVLHGFLSGQETGTASLEAKLIQHLKAMREEVLYGVFLNLRKAYDALDRDPCMEILVGCGIGSHMEMILIFYWEHLFTVA